MKRAGVALALFFSIILIGNTLAGCQQPHLNRLLLPL